MRPQSRTISFSPYHSRASSTRDDSVKEVYNEEEESNERFKSAPTQMMVSIHEAKTSPLEAVADLSALPAGARVGDIAEVRTEDQSVKGGKLLFVIREPPVDFFKNLGNLQVREISNSML